MHLSCFRSLLRIYIFIYMSLLIPIEYLSRFPKLIHLRIDDHPPMALIPRCVSRLETLFVQTATPLVWRSIASYLPKLKHLRVCSESPVDIKRVQLVVDSFPQVQYISLLPCYCYLSMIYTFI